MTRAWRLVRSGGVPSSKNSSCFPADREAARLRSASGCAARPPLGDLCPVVCRSCVWYVRLFQRRPSLSGTCNMYSGGLTRAGRQDFLTRLMMMMDDEIFDHDVVMIWFCDLHRASSQSLCRYLLYVRECAGSLVAVCPVARGLV